MEGTTNQKSANLRIPSVPRTRVWVVDAVIKTTDLVIVCEENGQQTYLRGEWAIIWAIDLTRKNFLSGGVGGQLQNLSQE